jgi:hypothetical protein
MGTVSHLNISIEFEYNDDTYGLIGLGIYTGGYYYALCKTNEKKGQFKDYQQSSNWYKYNDSSASLIRNIEIPNGTTPKIIVYEKLTPRTMNIMN